MLFQHVAFLPSPASFSSTFLKNCGRGESLGITTCLNNVVGGKQGHALCKIPKLQQILYLRHLNFTVIIRLSQSLGEPGHPQFGDIT